MFSLDQGWESKTAFKIKTNKKSYISLGCENQGFTDYQEKIMRHISYFADMKERAK